MAVCNKRHDSFTKSTHLRAKVILYQLAQLGFFFVGDENSRESCAARSADAQFTCSQHTKYIMWTKDWDQSIVGTSSTARLPVCHLSGHIGCQRRRQTLLIG